MQGLAGPSVRSRRPGSPGWSPAHPAGARDSAAPPAAASQDRRLQCTAPAGAGREGLGKGPYLEVRLGSSQTPRSSASPQWNSPGLFSKRENNKNRQTLDKSGPAKRKEEAPVLQMEAPVSLKDQHFNPAPERWQPGPAYQADYKRDLSRLQGRIWRYWPRKWPGQTTRSGKSRDRQPHTSTQSCRSQFRSPLWSRVPGQGSEAVGRKLGLERCNKMGKKLIWRKHMQED